STKVAHQHTTCFTAPTTSPRPISSAWPGSRRPWPKPWWPSTPLAGRLGVDGSGRVEIDCNGEGALFVIARSDVALDEIKDLKPSAELRSLLVPRIEPPSVILAVQVTFFKCGGVALGTALHHVSIDAMSAFHFFQTWSAFCRDGDRAAEEVELPCHDRTLLRAWSPPPAVQPDALLMFYPKLAFSEPSGPIATEVFAISRDQVAALKRLCGGGASTFCAVSALVWQCACVARRLPLDSKSRLTFPANVRRRVKPPLPERYFGNALVRVGVAAAVRDIASEALGSVAGRVGAAIARMDGDDEVVQSAIDYYETAEQELDSQPAKGTLPETELQIISWLGMPVYDADFGWGKPGAMSRADSSRGGLLHLMSNGPAADGGVRVLTCMAAANIKELERLLYEALARC
ncbi:putrescine hydroxycinnamoyltransferase 1-like, partial [Panicum virgatum]